MALSNQAGQALAIVAAALAAGTAVAMAIEATPGHGKFGKSRAARPADDEPAENPVRRPSRKEMIAALGLEAEGKKRSEKYDFSTKEYWNKIRNGTSRADASARRTLGIT